MTPGTTTNTAAPTRLAYTVFADRFAKSLDPFESDWPSLTDILRQPETHRAKDTCPLIKLAKFGTAQSKEGSLRHNANVLSISGIEADYDGEVMPVETAAFLLDVAGIRAAIYTSPSHTPERPRWRVLAPLSREYPPAERERFVARLNGVLGGVLASESFTLSQAFYYGRVAGRTYEVETVEGDCIDLRDDLDADAIGRDGGGVTPRTGQDDFARQMAIKTADEKTIADLDSALAALPDVWFQDYPKWINKIGMALKSLARSPVPDQALDLFHKHSARCAGYDPDEAQRKWDTLNPDTITFTTIFHLAKKEAGWSATKGVARDLSCDELRREAQKREAQKIGESVEAPPIAEIITLQEALDRFVFLAEGSRVTDRLNPHYDLSLDDFKNLYLASRQTIKQEPQTKADGTVVQRPDVQAPVAFLWERSPNRRTAVSRTFKAGGPEVLPDPNGKMCLNMWRPFDRSVVVDNMHGNGIELFLEHVEFLFGDDAPRFLDWLAHIEQEPGVLPHTSWLHISNQHGLGRNWLASCLARVWAGAVAPNFDLVGCLRSSFNDRLSRKVLAIVDEIREGGRDSAWDHSEQLKSLLVQEVREINPKYGRRRIEYNSCRWLILSNHMAALPLDQNDRRVEVVAIDKAPRPAEAYTKLYQLLDDKLFIATVAAYLGKRDISNFNPGDRAKLTTAKVETLATSLSPMANWVRLMVQHWPCDLIRSSDLQDLLNGDDPRGGSNLSAAQRRTLEQFGVQALGTPKKIDGKLMRLSIVRNVAEWKRAPASAIAEHYRVGQAKLAELKEVHKVYGPRDLIDAIMAEG